MLDDSAQLSLDFSVAEGPGDWQVRQSARARRLTARVFRSGRVEIVVPVGTRAATVQRFVAHSREWIESAVQRAERRPPPARLVSDEFPPLRLELGATGEQWESDASWWRGSPELLRQQLRRRLQRRAAEWVQPQLQSIAAKMQVTVSAVQLRFQRSRWGSCSPAGRISLNACLLFQRPEVVRYLLVHELAHRRHLNHSAAFWRVVAQFEPNWRELDRELSRGFLRVPRWILHPVSREQAS